VRRCVVNPSELESIPFLMKSTLIALMVLPFVCSGAANGYAQQAVKSDNDATEAVRALAKRIENCPSTEEIAQFKKRWVKVAWGPPLSVKFDVEKTVSKLYPYKGIIEFSVPYYGGEHRKSRDEAQNDKELSQVEKMVARDGIEPPTPAFSGRRKSVTD